MFHPGRFVPLMSGSYVGPLGSERTRRRIACVTVLATLSAVISGCAVGPNFHPAPAPDANGYVPGKLASPAAEHSGPRVAGQHFVSGEDVSARWWAAFKSQPLNDLIKQSVEHNPNLQAAEAAIRIAQYNALAQRGLWFPQVTGNSTSSSILVANPGQVPPIPTEGEQTQFSLVTHQLTVTFVPDIWGGNLRAVESLDAVTEQQLFQLEAAYLALTSNVVAAAIQEASLRGQIAATQRIIGIERNLLDILKRQFSFGQAAQADVLEQDAALAQAEELLPPPGETAGTATRSADGARWAIVSR
jgi:outer membrane protein TolC